MIGLNSKLRAPSALAASLVVAGVLVEVPACSSDSSSSSPSPTEKYLRDYRQLDCARRTTCCEVLGFANDSCNKLSLKAPAGGAFDADRGRECLDALATWDYCQTEKDTSKHQKGPPSCSMNYVFHIPVALGQACMSDMECSADATAIECAGLNPLCRTVPVAGESCDPVSNYGGNCTTDHELYCDQVDKVWKPCIAVGGSCLANLIDSNNWSSSHECVEGSKCRNPTQTGPGQCVALKTIGTACDREDDCVSGAYCDQVNAPWVCKESKPTGASCVESGMTRECLTRMCTGHCDLLTFICFP